MNCPNCDTPNRPGAKFCNECGNPLPLACPSCGANNRSGAKFCDECGASLTTQIASPALPQEPAIQAGPSTETPSLVEPRIPDAERRQLTVMFCDLVDSTALSGRLDPEDLREVVRAYQATCADVIQRFDGYVAQHLGDGLLIYFGYPAAHEDDAQRAVRTGLGIIDAMQTLNEQLEQSHGIQIAVRIGIHTGLVVIGDIGAGVRQEQLALGETPNIAARIQGLAKPNTLVMSTETYRLTQGFFDCESLGEHDLRGVAQPIAIYRVLGDTGIQSRLDIASARGLTPLVGRESESTLLFERWEQVKDRQGQVVLLSGEAGIGKSRLVQTLKDHVSDEPHIRWECRSSPYFANSALYPVIDLIQRTLRWQRDDPPHAKLERLEQGLSQYRLSLEESVPLFAPLLSVTAPENRYAPLNLSPQRQREKTLEAILAILIQLSEQQPVLFILEDLHWTDPTTLELLELLIDQTPTASIYTLLTCRPEYQPSWSHRSYLTEITVNRLFRQQIDQLATQVASGKMLPAEVIGQLADRTDGVPLYVEEMTKAVLESGVLQEVDGEYELTGAISSLSIPATLQDSLMARLDRLVTAKAIAQYASVIGRQFSYELLQAVSELDEATLQRELGRLVEAELVYQRGVIPHATYTFKHALIQDTAYESLLRSTRQGYHRRIAEVLAGRFSETAQTQPELLAHHYTEAGQDETAIRYWQQAGQWARQRSAYIEAIRHSQQGLLRLENLPDTPEHNKRELDIQLMLGSLFVANQGGAAPEVVDVFERARALCYQLGDTGQLVAVLRGLWNINIYRGAVTTSVEFAEEALRVAEREDHPMSLIAAHRMLGTSLLWLGKFVEARRHLDHVMERYDPKQHDAYIAQVGGAGTDPGVGGLSLLQLVLWCLGYPDQARQTCEEGLALASNRLHPFSSGYAFYAAAFLHRLCRDPRTTQEYAASAIQLSSTHKFPAWETRVSFFQGWALAEQGQVETSLSQIEQAMKKRHLFGIIMPDEYYTQAEVLLKKGEITAALGVLAVGQDLAETDGCDWFEAEGARLKGQCLLAQPAEQSEEAESCFRHALDIARSQHAKSWELRAATSLAKLWQSQGKRQEAYDLLAPVYNWFTEGFDTADLIDAKAVLNELSEVAS